ncbi:acetoacetate--CoA ligase [Thiofilum flexile]|uniref:acetoacetate--CoA ligase n=1 Tax=Thiofilum flexile TaxID=125627 RepID=UPI0003776ECD|nr:acetoacetate--CoA ligase [Thiofilum flexile]
MSTLLWQPSAKQMQSSTLWHFMQWAAMQTQQVFNTYAELYQWSIEDSPRFWSLLWDYTQIRGVKGEQIVVNQDNIEKAVWFPDAQLNFAENLLREPDAGGDTVAIYFKVEDQAIRTLTFDQLLDQTQRVATWLKAQGVTAGDRVAGYVANTPETVIAMLAATSLGAIWTSTSPDFGEESVIERFGQTEPKVLFAVDGYFYNGKRVDIRSKVQTVQAALPSIEQTVIVPLLEADTTGLGVAWAEVLQTPSLPLEFVPRGFNDPLYILYSSGTTGKPKCITHKVGGVLLQHLKEQQLHSDIRAGDRVFYFTTCGWMMWNWLVSALASKAALVLYEGSPFYPSGEVLWDYAEAVGVTLFGTSAKYLEALNKANIQPKTTRRLHTLRTLCSTGSVLAPESFDYVYAGIKRDMCLASISGGTDIVSCFVLGNPLLPVYRGESQCRGLGMAVEVFNEEGKPVVGQKGELVCTQTFPSQPAFFWGDSTGEKYHNAYFAQYPNVWQHGDYVELTEHDGVIIYGRSDATLNPGGVRIGTAEIYRYVEQLDEVLESIAIGQDWDNDVRVVLFVVLKPAYVLDAALIQKIRSTIRQHCTPRHVPAKVIQVAAIPRTKSGKIVELAVREVVHNRVVKNIHALANPEALEYYRNLIELQT